MLLGLSKLKTKLKSSSVTQSRELNFFAALHLILTLTPAVMIAQSGGIRIEMQSLMGKLIRNLVLCLTKRAFCLKEIEAFCEKPSHKV